MPRRLIQSDWTPEQIGRLKQLVGANASAVRAAAALKKSVIIVRKKARELGKPFPSVLAERAEREAKYLAAIAKQ